MIKKIKAFGLEFDGLHKADVFGKKEKTNFIVTVNAAFIVDAKQNKRLASIINKYTSTLDGQVPFLLAKAKNNWPNIDKISGSELIFDAVTFSRKSNKKLFFLGSMPDVNKKALEIARSNYNAHVDGFSPKLSDYPFCETWNQEIKDKLEQYRPHVLFVGFGMLKQEYWIDDNYDFLNSIGVETVIGCGGSIDMLAGKYPRAPKLIQTLCLEGLYRTLQQPSKERFKRLLDSFKVFKAL